MMEEIIRIFRFI